jgi:serine/threonine-protein kinase
MDILIAHLHEKPRPLRETNPRVSVPPALERLVMRLLAKTPEERFPDVQALAEALRVLAVELGLSSGPSTWSGRPGVGNGGSGVRKSLGQPLRLQAADVTASARPVIRRGISRTARGAVILGVLGAAGIYAAISFGRGADDDSAKPAAAPAQPPPVPAQPPADEPVGNEPAAAADPSAATQDVDMVFAPGEASSGLPAVKLNVTSDPPGAYIWLRGKRVGMTPASFEWRDAEARQGNEVMMFLRLKGYKPFLIRHKIDGAQLHLSATLEPLEGATPAPAEPRDGPVLKIQPSEQMPTNPYQIAPPDPIAPPEDEPVEEEPAAEEEATE